MSSLKKLKLPWWVVGLLAAQASAVLFKGLHLERLSWTMIVLPGLVGLLGLVTALLVVGAILNKARR